MRHCLFVLLLIATQSLQAQISHDFRNAPLTEALRTIEQSQSKYTFVMLTDDLEHLRVSVSIKDMTVPDAVEKVKVYTEESETSRLLGRKVDDGRFVMQRCRKIAHGVSSACDFMVI